MNEVLEKVLADKRVARKRLAALPFAEKLKHLERLRNRSRLFACNPLRQRKGDT